MSMIMGVGTKLDWSPSDEKLQKTASTGEQEVQEEANPLYEAAAAFLKTQAEKEAEVAEDGEGEMEKEGGLLGGIGEGIGKAVDTVQDITGLKDEESAGTCKDDDMVELDIEEDAEESKNAEESKTDVEEAVREVVDKAEEAEAMTERVEDALEGVEEAVQGVKDAVGSEADAEVEVEIEVEEEDQENEEEEPGGEDIVVESDPEAEASAYASTDEEAVEASTKEETKGTKEGEEAKMDRSASSEEFCKFAKLTPANRKKLVDYWVGMLGYPRDFVKLMVKDYEK